MVNEKNGQSDGRLGSSGSSISHKSTTTSNPAPIEDDDLELEDLCDIIVSYKCRHCSFVCQDKRILAKHAKEEVCRNQRDGDGRSAGVGEDFIAAITSKREELTKIELCTPVPSIPPTPEAYIVDDEDEQDLQEEDNHDNDEDDMGDGDMDVDGDNDDTMAADIFLCAECDIVFPSKELCCQHMHQVHQLIQFNNEFIQKEIIAKKNKGSRNKQKRNKRQTKLPSRLTLAEGVIVPKRYRVSREGFHTCSKCPVRFESEEVVRFHEQCHTEQCHDDHTKRSRSNSSRDDENDTSRDQGMSMDDSRDEHDAQSQGGIVTVTSKEKRIRMLSRFLCPVCEAKGTPSFFLKWGICAGHLWREHKIDCELYSCTICKKFKSHQIVQVTEHEKIHQKDTNHVCKTCGKKFKQQKQLRTHEKYHKEKMTVLPPPEDSRWYTPKECPICKRILSDAKCLKKHISAVHNKLKPYNCNICGHTTARKAELQLHVRQHTGEKPYKCSICPFTTGDHNSLRKHKMRHGDKRPYSCPYCEYRCIQTCAFKKHIVSVHPGQDVVYLCQLCSHASVNETLFNAHQKDHAEGRIPQQSVQSQTNNDSNNACSADCNPPSSNNNPKSPRKPRWMEEDSVDVIDTGGVTIPASPSPTNINSEPVPTPSCASPQNNLNQVEEANSPTNSNSNSADIKSPEPTLVAIESISPMASPVQQRLATTRITDANHFQMLISDNAVSESSLLSNTPNTGLSITIPLSPNDVNSDSDSFPATSLQRCTTKPKSTNSCTPVSSSAISLQSTDIVHSKLTSKDLNLRSVLPTAVSTPTTSEKNTATAGQAVGQTTYILLPPNTPFSFPPVSVQCPSTSTTITSPSDNDT